MPLLKALDKGIKRAIITWNRRSGKDKTCFNYVIKRVFERVGTYYYFLPTYNQAKKVIWDNIDNDGFRMLDHIPKDLIHATNATELKIELKNGSIIQLIAANEFKKSGVGANPIGVVFSEYSVTDSEAWQFVSPILAANGGWAIFNYTPRGRNHAWELLQKAKDNPNWFWEILTVDNTKVLDKESLEEERKNMPEALFRQEYYCEFLEGAGQFFTRILENVWTPDEPSANHIWQLGVDLAKYQDWTVLTPFDLNKFRVHTLERFNQVDWNLQKARIEALARKLNNAKIIPDSTGVGDPITEDLQRAGLSVEPFKFTEQSKRQLLDHLSILLQQDKIKIPNDDGLIGELQSMRFTLSDKGKLKVAVPDNMTDDRIMSLALAVKDCTWPLNITASQEGNEFELYKQDFN